MSQSVRIDVPNVDTLLAADALGPGALLVLQQSATGGGSGFTTVETKALEAGVHSYEIYDGAGVATTWYRTRYTDSLGANPSSWSAEFQLVASLLTVDQVLEAVKTSVAAGALQVLLDAIAAELVALRGPVTGPLTEVRPGGGRVLTLRRQVASLVSVSEIVGTTSTALLTTDYGLRRSAIGLLRQPFGWRWADSVEVVYTPVDDTAERKRVQLALVKLELAYSGLTSQRTAQYAETQASGEYSSERRRILASFADQQLIP